MVRLVRAEKMVLSEYVGFDGSRDDQHGIYAFIYVRNVRCHANKPTNEQWKVEQYSV